MSQWGMAYQSNWLPAGRGPKSAQDFKDPGRDDCPFETVGSAAGFTGELTAQRIGLLVVSDIQGQDIYLTDRAPPANDTITFIQMVVSGQVEYRTASNNVESLASGDLIIRRSGQKAVLSAEHVCRILSVTLPERLLSPRLLPRSAVENTILRIDERRRLSVGLLQSFIAGLCEREAPDAHPSGVIVDALGALVAMTIHDGRPDAAVEVDLPTRRLAELLEYIKENAANPALTPRLAAADLNMSLRYLHKLMTLTGHSFGAEVTRLRLEFCRTALARGGYRTIADVAITAGFNDLSQFNRQFRAAFDMTPSEARRRAAPPARPVGDEISIQRRK